MKLSIDRILVPVKHNDESYRAAELGLAIARGMGAMLTLIHVHMQEAAKREIVEIGPDALDEITTESFHELLDELVGDATKVSLESIVRHSVAEVTRVPNSPGEVVVDYAKAHDVDLIVLGARRHSNLEDLIMGSIASEILEAAPCAVTVLM